MKIKKLLYFFICPAIVVITLYILQGVSKHYPVNSLPKYELVKNWPDLPAGLHLGNPTGIGLDTSQHLIVFHRADRNWPLFGPMPTQLIQNKTILIIDKRSGKLINSWGDHLFIMPHGLTVDNRNNIWVTDVGLHQVFKFNYAGKLLMKLGEACISGNDRLHFDKPTDIAVAKDGSFYVSDGYGNNRIIKFSADGKYLFEWGKKGSGNGEFNIPHAITLDEHQNVYVADRENNRIQKFDSSGCYIDQYHFGLYGDIGSVVFDKTGSRLFAVDDLRFLWLKHRGSDILCLDEMGNIEASFGRSGGYKGNTSWYHDLTVDNEGNIYVCDILENRVQKFRRL